MRNRWLTNRRVVNWNIDEAWGDTIAEKFESLYRDIAHAIGESQNVTLTMGKDTEVLFQCGQLYDYENRVWRGRRGTWTIVVDENLPIGRIHISRPLLKNCA